MLETQKTSLRKNLISFYFISFQMIHGKWCYKVVLDYPHDRSFLLENSLYEL